MRRALSIGVFLSAAAVASNVGAAPASPGETLFREGRTAMQEKDFDRACQKFAESQRVEPAPGTELNLGDCEAQRNHLVASAEAFRAAAKAYTDADKRAFATSRADETEAKIPRLVVHATTPVPGLVVRAGAETLSLEAEIKRDPGELVLRAEAPGRRAKELRVTLVAERRVEVDVGTLEPDNGAAPEPAKPLPASDGPPFRTVGIAVGAVGAASFAVGAVTGILAFSRGSTVKDHCNAALACDATGVDAAHSGTTFTTVSTVTVIVGAAALVGGAVLYYLSRRSAPDTAFTSLGVVAF